MSDESPPALRLKGVRKRFPGANQDAVQALDLAIPRGAIVSLIGPSGCGKTTTLRMINRLIEPTGGRIELEGTDVTDVDATELRRGIGYVIQQVGLFPHRTIGANIGTVPRALGWDKRRIAERTDELVDLVGLERDMLPRYPDQLSGGQQQRVGVARALAADPPVLLMDEPFGAVDPIVRGRLQDELLALQERVHKTIVLVTHDLDEALKLSDRIALLNVGGVLEQFASPDELLRAPASSFVERFIGGGRSMRRLGLTTLAAVTPHRGSVVSVDATPQQARAAMDEFRTDWVGLTDDDDRFLGWVARASVADGVALDTLERHEPAATVTPDDTLATALETIMNSRTLVAVVREGERFLGVVTLEQIHAELGALRDAGDAAA
ncbi:MAG: betaine/proline/choline family ABC transporter ATP-binding protein [Nitriliruptoraceae bacterium]|nr:betaine/proline/choline family ABC transporter ATP-binding protein [Nitriliruptoraceae bacterium]